METKENQKPKMTDEERLELAKKLDADLDKYMKSLEKRQWDEGWPIEKLEEEMEKHPFFMKKAPQPGEEVSPLMEGLQQLKYDPDENTPEELATSYKEDGNFNFKHKNYRLAILSYTEGLKAKCQNHELNSNLYNNRSAAHFYLENFRSSLKDCEYALKLNPNYKKILIRAALCYYKLEDYDKCIIYCEKVLLKDPKNEEILILLEKATKKSLEKLKIKERDERKHEKMRKKDENNLKILLNLIKERGIRLANQQNVETILNPKDNMLHDSRVHLNQETGSLIWPVALMYPEHQITEYIQCFDENTTIKEQLDAIFSNLADWDKEKKYKPDTLNVYFEGKLHLNDQPKLVPVDINDTLLDILKNPQFLVQNGTPCFIIFVKGSRVENQYKKQFSS